MISGSRCDQSDDDHRDRPHDAHPQRLRQRPRSSIRGAERLALYRRLDDIKDEPELQKFTAEITDRFGPIPGQVTELLEGIRLRWLGQSRMKLREAWRRWC